MAGRKRQLGRGGESPPGVLGDETIEQNLNQEGNPEAKITREDVEAAFDRPRREGEGEPARGRRKTERNAAERGFAGAKPGAARIGARRGTGKAKTGRKSGASRGSAR